ncbi:MAG: SctK family type III secretion system sorting platform protein [Puniceicoccales bacterium]|jgi:hypothetical protein|nr:SctK family type III secretion system sorting platform protein [Puniceicoccales bacterium]
MSEVGTSALKKVLQSNFAFFRNWYDFHYNVSSYVDRSLYSDIIDKYSDKIFDIMFTSPSLRAGLKCKILHHLGLNEQVNYAVNSPVLPFAMLQSKTLAKLQPIIGAMVCFKDVNKVVAKRDLDTILELIGKDVYTFVVKRSLIFWKKIPTLNRDFSTVKLDKRIPMCGKLVLEYVVSSLPLSVIKRMGMRSGIAFTHVDGCMQEDVVKAIDLVKYILVNFFSDSEDAKLCLN